MTKPVSLQKRPISWGKVLIMVFFTWFVLACLVLPNLNLIRQVFFAEGGLTIKPFQKLLKSKRAMKALRNSFILAPTLSLTVGLVGISLVLITEYFLTVVGS